MKKQTRTVDPPRPQSGAYTRAKQDGYTFAEGYGIDEIGDAVQGFKDGVSARLTEQREKSMAVTKMAEAALDTL